jgi:hypothetical protein
MPARERALRIARYRFGLPFPYPPDCVCGDQLRPHVRLCPRAILPREPGRGPLKINPEHLK